MTPPGLRRGGVAGVSIWEEAAGEERPEEGARRCCCCHMRMRLAAEMVAQCTAAWYAPDPFSFMGSPACSSMLRLWTDTQWGLTLLACTPIPAPKQDSNLAMIQRSRSLSAELVLLCQGRAAEEVARYSILPDFCHVRSERM